MALAGVMGIWSNFPMGAGGKKVVIVGSSSGLGAALGGLYRERGWKVQAYDRSHGDLEDAAAAQNLAEKVASDFPDTNVFFYCAGKGEFGYSDQVPVEAYRRSMQLNFLSPLAFLQAFHRKNPLGLQFVVVLSGAGEFLVPGLGPYALGKRMLRDFLRICDLEQSFPGILIRPVWPGPMSSSFDEKAVTHKGFRPPGNRGARTPIEVAQKIYSFQQGRRRRLVLSRLPNVLGYLQSLFPTFFRWLIWFHPAFKRVV